MAKISQVITKIEELLMIILMAALAILMIFAVIFRYFFKDPIPWAGEVSIFLLIWTSFIGGSWGLKYGTQASVTFLYDAVSKRSKRIFKIVQDCMMIAFLFILIYYAYKWMMNPAMLLQKSSSLQLPMWIPYSAVFIGLIFAAIHLLSHLIDTLKNREGENT